MSKRESGLLNLQFYLLLFLFIIIPLAITTLTYSRTDLPKSASLQIFGGIFIITALLVFYFRYFSLSKDENFNITVEYDKTFDPYVFLFFLSAILSTIFSINPKVSFYGQYERHIGLITYIYIFFIYHFSSYIFKDGEKLKNTILIIEFTALTVSVYTILQYLNMDPFNIQPLQVKRPVSTLGNAVFTGGFLMMVLPFSLLNISQKKSKALKIIFPLIIISAIILTQTRSAYLAVIAQLFIIAIFYPFLMDKSAVSYKRRLRIIIFVFVFLCVLFVIISLLFPQNPFTQRLLSIFSEEYNPRWILWRDAFNIFTKYPVFGPGIAMFPNALEEFYSYQLRHADVKRYFDNAHNNFLQVLFTMGIVGLAAYIIIIFQGFRTCIRMIFSGGIDKKRKMVFLSFLMMLGGYSVYGLTNFDEITITFYFFMFIAMLRAFYVKENTAKIIIKRKLIRPVLIFPAIIILILCYNIYNSVNELRADNYFLRSTILFSQQKFADGVYNMNSAILLNKSCPAYRFTLATNVYKIATSNSKMAPESKNHLLKQAADETIKARENYFNKNECDGLLSLIYYEMGRVNEADSIKNDVLTKNPINVGYRLNLALYYLKLNDFKEALDNIDIAIKFNPNNLETMSIAAYYNIKINNYAEASRYCEMIFQIDPDNRAARELLKQIK